MSSIEWLVEFQGRRKLLSEIDHPTLLAMLEPMQGFLAERLSSIEEASDPLKVVFFWDESASLRFALKGAPATVNGAIDLIGERAEFWSSH